MLFDFSALCSGWRGFVLASHLYDQDPEDYDARGSGGRYHGVRVEPHAAEDDEERALPRSEQAVEVALHREAEAEAGGYAGDYAVGVADEVALEQDARVVAEGEGRHEGEEAEAAGGEARLVRLGACYRSRRVSRERDRRRNQTEDKKFPERAASRLNVALNVTYRALSEYGRSERCRKQGSRLPCCRQGERLGLPRPRCCEHWLQARAASGKGRGIRPHYSGPGCSDERLVSRLLC